MSLSIQSTNTTSTIIFNAAGDDWLIAAGVEVGVANASFGVLGNVDNATLINHGDIESQDGVGFLHKGGAVVNAGDGLITGDVGVAVLGFNTLATASVANFGSIIGILAGVSFANAAACSLDNSGSIYGIVDGVSDASTNFPAATIRNTGTIGGGIDGIGVSAHGLVTEIVNAGTIIGKTHAIEVSLFAAVDLINHGTVNGDVTLAATGADNTIFNDGIITGPVSFGAGNDSYIGAGNAPITVYGNLGNDTLRGGNGDDVLIGGPGHDILAGGGGADRFGFVAALGPGNVDHVGDFTHRVDRIELSHAVFAALNASGPLARSMFVTGSAAHNHHQHILYERAHGTLFYDADGSGPHAKVLFAILDNHTALSAADFLVTA